MELRIGFANKYYTLWEVTETTQENSRGNYLIIRYRYLHNLSFDKDKAFAKFPEAKWDETLQGRRGSFYKSSRIIEDDKFNFGKYATLKFTECNDYNYMMWFYNNCANENQKQILGNILINQNYGLCEGIMYSPEKMEEIRKEEEKRKYGESKLASGNPFIVLFERNLSSEGTYFVSQLNITLKFRDYKVYTYEDYYYGLPCDKKGTGKRIKNRQVMIGQYILESSDVAIVTDWKYV